MRELILPSGLLLIILLQLYAIKTSITVCLKDFQYDRIVNKSSEQRAVFMITAANIRVKLCTEARKLGQDTCTFWQVQIHIKPTTAAERLKVPSFIK